MSHSAAGRVPRTESNGWTPCCGGGPAPFASPAIPGPPALSDTETYQYSAPNGGKNKTPMCLVAELARFNRLCHIYKLDNESGPAHQKTFTVTLVLREGEQYTGQGASIKKAQQNAAELALEQSKLPRPPERNAQRRHSQDSTPTATVALNGLAHEQGLVAIYTPLDPPNALPAFIPIAPGRYYRAPFSTPRTHYVALRLSNLFECVGQGVTRQMARHHAAMQAIHFLQARASVTINQPHITPHVMTNADLAASSGEDLTTTTSGVVSDEEDSTGRDLSAAETKNNHKSPVSLVHELALHRRLDVHFEIVSESGPAHDRRYLLQCSLMGAGQTVTSAQAEGGSKRLAKHAACQQLIEQLTQMAWLPLPSTFTQPRFRVPKEAKRKTITKEVKIDPNYGQQINPVSRLIQIQQSKKETEPEFQLINESGHSRYKEFLMEVSLNGLVCQGVGPNKKLAKRNAAENMLDKLGYTKPMPKPGKSVLKQTTLNDDIQQPSANDDGSQVVENDSDHQLNGESPKPSGTRKVTFQLENPQVSIDANGSLPVLFTTQPSSSRKRYKDSRKSLSPEQQKAISTMARSLLEKISTENESDERVTARDHLEYLAGTLGFGVQFTDFPKTGENDYLSLVTLGVSPPQVCHGSGDSTHGAQHQAALAALQALAQGLGNNCATLETPCSSSQNDAPPEVGPDSAESGN